MSGNRLKKQKLSEKSIDSLLKIAAVPLSILIVAISAYFIYFGLAENRNKPALKPAPQINSLSKEEEVKQTVENISSRITSTSLTEAVIIFKDKPQPLFTYMLSVNPTTESGPNTSVYLFDEKKYIFVTGNDPAKTPTMELCDVIDSIYDRPDSILEALKEANMGGKISFPIWALKGELEAGNLTPIIVEWLYSFRKFSELQHTHAEILIRGYADGQKGFWDQPLNANRYYDTIPRYPYSEPNSESSSPYIKEERPFPIGSRYENKDLPNLRAFYVKQVLVDPYLQVCKENIPQTHVLEGFEFKDLKDKPLERKVQIFILIYDNDPT